MHELIADIAQFQWWLIAGFSFVLGLILGPLALYGIARWAEGRPLLSHRADFHENR